MKFFFPELSFCFGATVMTPETEVIRSDVSTTRRRRRNGSFSKHWRPELSAIAEDGGALSSCQRRSRKSDIIVRSEKKPLNKARSPRKSRSHSSHSYGGDYRQFTHSMAIPAFAPTSFVF
ncbi:hypothetical protein SSX86_015798 [Deinandra increscens subsp. villosa]|uniref:Uncharacterized protein n=1 Tax=Deinandra increscens subsp. villosa TaxID=3103831 RepID=A0AAP0CYF1_9ASTR